MADSRLNQSEREQMIASGKALWDTQTLLYCFTDLPCCKLLLLTHICGHFIFTNEQALSFRFGLRNMIKVSEPKFHEQSLK